jgi:hypothetical protein
MCRSCSTFVVIVAAILLTAIRPAPAQSIFATVIGSVTDTTSAVISGAQVTVTNVSTNEKRKSATNSSGNYEVNNLFPGVYVLEVEMPGFAKYRREQIELASNQNERVDVKLDVSGQVTQISVTSEATTPIETETAKLSDVRTLEQLQSLPLAARSAYRFLVLTPGVTGGQNGTMSVSGSGLRQVHFAVDGVTMSDVRSSNTIGPTLNFIEAFEELKIDLGNNSAEFKGVGTLDVVSKRGGNRMHGSVYDYYSTGEFLARDYFTHQRQGSPNHGFGGSISGPAYFPKLYDGRDKTFWFASYETSFAPEGVNNLTPTVPLAAWKQGDFSGQSIVVKDPLASGVPFPNNIIPQARINSVAKQYLPFWPDPNFGNLAVFGSQNFREQFRIPFAKPHNFQTRVDHRISDKNTIFGRYLHQRQQNPDVESGLPGTLGYHQQLRVVKHVLAADTHIFSPSLVNEARFGISFNTNPQSAKDINGPAFLKQAGLMNVTRDGIIPDVNEIPVVTFAQGPGIQAIQVTNQRAFNEDLTYQWQDTVSKISGKHSLRTGAEVNLRYLKDQNQSSNLFGNFQFTNQYTGLNFADFLLGMPTTITRAPYALMREDRSIAYDFFVQDNYKITNRLTLNLGIRYELHPGWTTTGDRISGFDVKTGSIVVPDNALSEVSPLFPTNLVPVIGNSKTSFNDRLMQTRKNNFAPRIGFAWRPFAAPTFVVRAGYGIFYDIIPYQPTLFGTPFVVSEPSYTNPANVSDPGFVQWPLAFPNISRLAGVSIPTTYQNGFKTGYAENWNFTLEKELAKMNLRASYVGTGGRQFPRPFNVNQPQPGPGLYVDKPRLFPNLPAITINVNGANHTYHALNLEARRSFFQSLTFQTSLALAKDLGTNDLTPENTYNLAREKAQQQITPFRRWVGFFIYELPVGRGKHFGPNLHGVAGALLGGWQTSVSGTLQDGQNETPVWSAPDIQGIAFTTSRTPPTVAYRPNCISDPNAVTQTIQRWFDVNAFQLPTVPGVFGTCGRSVIHGPAVRVMHGAMFKTFKLERFRFRLGTQITNILNHPNWSNLSAGALALDNTSGRAIITGASGATSGSAGDAAGPRAMRLDLRIDF